MLDERDTSISTVRFMQNLAEHLRPYFPHYAGVLLDEVNGKRMTNEKWNRVAAILSSLAALPGTCFLPEEHEARNPALSAVVIAQKMAYVSFGNRRDSNQCLELVMYLIDDIQKRFKKE